MAVISSSERSTTSKNVSRKETGTNNFDNKYTFQLWTSSLLVFSLAVLCFANSFDGDFVFDDAEAIQNNKDLLPSTSVWDLLYHDFWGRKLTNLSHKSYRPLTVLTFRWNYMLADGLHPMGFHVVNILLHGVVSALLPVFFSLMLADNAKLSGRSDGAVSIWSVLCSILFAVHPVHTESVAGVVGRADLLCALFFLCSFVSYVQACTAYSKFRPESFSFPWLVVSCLFCSLATFSKEQGITVIGVCSAYDLLSVCGVDFGVLLGLAKSTTSEQNGSSTLKSSNEVPLKKNGVPISSWKLSLFKRQLVLAVSAVLLLTVRWRVMGSSPPTFQPHDNPHSFVNGSLYRALNYNYLYAINTWILLAPHWLCFDWSMGCVPTITSLHDPRLIVVLVFYVIFLLLLRTCLCSGHPATRRSVTLSLAIIIIPYLPATNIFFRVGFVIAERVLYLNSAGFCLLVTIGAQKLYETLKLKNAVLAGFTLLVLVFVVRSVQRSNEWRRDMWLFRAGERICPLNAKVHYNIAKLCADRGEADEAIERYRHAIHLNPVYDQAMNNLANILKDRDQTLEAEMLLDKAISISPEFAAAWMNRGIVKAALKKYAEAESSYKKGIRYRRNYPDCYYNLGNLYIEMGRNQEALTAFKNATNLRPTHWNSWNNAVILLDNLNQYDQAVNLALAALKVVPDNSAIMSSLASIYGKQDKFPESEKWFLAAIKRDPHNANLYLNLGVLYHRWGKYKEAELAYQRSNQLKPNNPVIAENLKLLQAKMKS